MKETRSNGLTKMWYAVDKDGFGKLYTSKPERHQDVWHSSTKEEEPNEERILYPYEAKPLGRTWKDEPIQVEMIYQINIKLSDEQ